MVPMSRIYVELWAVGVQHIMTLSLVVCSFFIVAASLYEIAALPYSFYVIR